MSKTMHSSEFLDVFARHRGDAPVMVASGISGAVWRHQHVERKTIYNAGMAYTVPTCFGLALARPDQKVIAVEGDGSFLMGLPNLATIGRYAPRNLVVIVYNNATYMPTGTSGELTSAASHGSDLAAFAAAAGIPEAHEVSERNEFDELLGEAVEKDGPWVIVANVGRDRDSWNLAAPTRALDRVIVAMEFQEELRKSSPADTVPTSEAEFDPYALPEVIDRVPGWRAGADLYSSMREAGIDFASYLPEGVLYPVQAMIERDPSMMAVCCSREDEGIAICSGMALDDRVPALVIEGTGIGMSALVLASQIIRRRPLVIVSSHSRVLGVRAPWNDQAAMVNEPVLDALGIPAYVLEDRARAAQVFRESVRSALVLKKPVAIVIPPYLMDDD